MNTQELFKHKKHTKEVRVWYFENQPVISDYRLLDLGIYGLDYIEYRKKSDVAAWDGRGYYAIGTDGDTIGVWLSKGEAVQDLIKMHEETISTQAEQGLRKRTHLKDEA